MMLSDEVMSSTSWQVRGTSRVLAKRDSDRVILTKKELFETGRLFCWIKNLRILLQEPLSLLVPHRRREAVLRRRV